MHNKSKKYLYIKNGGQHINYIYSDFVIKTRPQGVLKCKIFAAIFSGTLASNLRTLFYKNSRSNLFNGFKLKSTLHQIRATHALSIRNLEILKQTQHIHSLFGIKKILKDFVIQERLTPIKACLENNNIIDIFERYLDLKLKMWEEGICGCNNFFFNYGINKNNEIRCIDIGDFQTHFCFEIYDIIQNKPFGRRASFPLNKNDEESLLRIAKKKYTLHRLFYHWNRNNKNNTKPLSIREDFLFDKEYYLNVQTGLKGTSEEELFIHYLTAGWKEGNNPSTKFDTKFYLNTNPNVKKSKINPLIHYVCFGRDEGRRPNP